MSWLTTVDPKRIGLLYGSAGVFLFVIGGIAAVLIRLQLAVPEVSRLSFAAYNQRFTLHGTTMIFLASTTIGNAAFDYIMPLQIGAHDVAFPQLSRCTHEVLGA